jgi:hypothetical protein
MSEKSNSTDIKTHEFLDGYFFKKLGLNELTKIYLKGIPKRF